MGRERPLDVCFVPFGLSMHRREGVDPSRFRDSVAELADLGVTWLTLSLPGDTRAAYCASVERFGNEVLAALD